MGYYEQNIEFISHYDNVLHDNYLKWKKDKNNSEIVVREGAAKDGNPYLIIEKNGKVQRLNSCYSPENEAKEWVKQFSLNNIKQVITMIGIGSGVFLKELKKACQNDAMFFIYEPSVEIFDYLMNHVDLIDLIANSNCNFIVHGLNEERFRDIILKILGWDNISFLITTEHPGYKMLFPKEYNYFYENVRDGWITTRLDRNTVAYFGESIAKNGLSSLLYLKGAHFYHQYINKFTDLSAIIVAAGPSLDKNIEYLREAKGKAVIFAVDTAMRELNKRGIEPDFVVTVDPQKILSYMTEEGTRKLPLFCTDYANQEIIKQHDGQKIFFDIQGALRKVLPKSLTEEKVFATGGSVANSTFSLCHILGFKTIILIGQDLAYANGASHAGNALVGEDTHGRSKMEVEDVFGNSVTTRREWYQYLIWFNDAIPKLKDEITVIDATEGGAKIKGTIIMPLAEAIDKYCGGEFDSKKMVSEMPDAYSEEELEKIKDYVQELIDGSDKMMTDVRQAIVDLTQLCRKCEEKNFDKEYRDLTKKILKIGSRINERPVCELVNMWNANKSQKILDNINQMTEDLSENEFRVYKRSLEYYKGIQKAVIEVKLVLQETLKKMRD